jgi:hypothetical protein
VEDADVWNVACLLSRPNMIKEILCFHLHCMVLLWNCYVDYSEGFILSVLSLSVAFLLSVMVNIRFTSVLPFASFYHSLLPFMEIVWFPSVISLVG